MAETRTGAPYIHFEAAYCDPAIDGCGVLIGPPDWPQDFIDNLTSDETCPNCEHKPLSHVSVTTADRIAGKGGDESK